MTRCVRRLLRAERLIARLLQAWDDSEAGNLQKVIEAMRVFEAEI